MSATMGLPGQSYSPPLERRARNRWFRRLLRKAGRMHVNLNCGGRGWYQADDWWDEAKQQKRRASGETVWCGEWQPAKFPRKYLR